MSSIPHFQLPLSFLKNSRSFGPFFQRQELLEVRYQSPRQYKIVHVSVSTVCGSQLCELVSATEKVLLWHLLHCGFFSPGAAN